MMMSDVSLGETRLRILQTREWYRVNHWWRYSRRLAFGGGHHPSLWEISFIACQYYIRALTLIQFKGFRVMYFRFELFFTFSSPDSHQLEQTTAQIVSGSDQKSRIFSIFHCCRCACCLLWTAIVAPTLGHIEWHALYVECCVERARAAVRTVLVKPMRRSKAHYMLLWHLISNSATLGHLLTFRKTAHPFTHQQTNKGFQ